MKIDKHYYDWKRFWVPRDGIIDLSDNGFLSDPEEHPLYAGNKNLKTNDELLSYSCIGLLGEPGAGKSHTLKQLLISNIGDKPDRHIELDLRGYASENRLYNAIFNDEKFTNWINSDYNLVISIDSLDECLINKSNISSMLIDEFAKYPVSRLKLLIACRTAEWPTILDQELGQLWGDNSFAVFELAPLRRQDVITAAKYHNIDADKFIRDLIEEEIVPFSIFPITLGFLIQQYEQENQFPVTKKDIYEHGCLRLCTEFNKNRVSAKRLNKLTPKVRFEIAQRIAAITILCKKPVIQYNIENTVVDEDQITIDQLCYGKDRIDGILRKITVEDVMEVLQTSLFSSRGGTTLGWSHWSFAEYMTAKFLTTRDFSYDQLQDILFHPLSEGSNKIIPQLREVASWIISIDHNFIPVTLKNDPELYLKSNIELDNNQIKKKIVESILELADNNKLTDRDHYFSHRYTLLKHAGLRKQLLPYITDRKRNNIVRRIAINIAESCSLKSIASELKTIALDISENYHIRGEAIYALSLIGSKKDSKDIQVILDRKEDDPDDQLKGYILRYLFKSYGIRKILPYLSAPNNDSFIGGYSTLLTYEIPKEIKDGEISLMLNWVSSTATKWTDNFTINSLRSKIIQTAFNRISVINNLDVLTKAITALIKNNIKHRDSLDKNERVMLSEENRRKILLSIIKNHQHYDPKRYHCHYFYEYGVYNDTDFLWLYEQLKNGDLTEKERDYVLNLLSYFFSYYKTEHTNIIIDNPDGHMDVNEKFASIRKVYFLDDPETHKIKTDYYKYNTKIKPEDLHPPIQIIVNDEISKIKKEGVHRWWVIVRALCLTDDSNDIRWNSELKLDIKQLPGWSNINSATKSKIISLAKQYLLEMKIDSKTWFCKDLFNRPAAAGVKAFLLIDKNDNNWIVENQAQIRWDLWVPSFLDYPKGDDDKDVEKFVFQLIGFAYKHYPTKTLNKLRMLIHKNNGENGLYYFEEITSQISGKKFENFLIRLLETENNLTPRTKRDLLTVLLKNNLTKGKVVAEKCIAKLGRKKLDAEYRKELSVQLIMSDFSSSFDTLYSLIKTRKKFGYDLLLTLFSSHSDEFASKFMTFITEEQIVKLYIWIRNNTDYEQYKREERKVSWVGHDDRLYNQTNELIHQLKTRGTLSAVENLEKLVIAYPEDRFLDYVLIEAKENMLRNTWLAIQPKELIDFSTNKHARLIYTNHQLLEVVIDSLKRYESELKSDLSEINNLWNDNKTPKSENHLTNNIAKHLRIELASKNIVINREVQIKTGSSDLKIESSLNTDASQHTQLCLIIEVKGCWNPGLKINMSTQLAGKYLSVPKFDTGIYLVGWYLCDYWSKKDYRKKATPKWKIHHAHKYFEDQAIKLSNGKNLIKSVVLDVRKEYQE